ncbi:copper ion binding protein [Thalictrum thalictroides]|uniref:Copper ion binding protein n=1 Tax=Thalictrum thalictroides TaxID=46969 RepID=A0A7J6V4W7_THATH|nr:copper ion binding protein [Thalictrum thalictroides]
MLRSKLKPLISSSLSTLNHQFLQRCSVSGTAKGKKTLKAGGALKRSVIPKKKGAKPPSTGGGGGGRMNQATERLNNMVDSCLNAPTPIRYLTPKQKAREAEREKLGLISKARQRELDGMKAKAKKSGKAGEEEEGFELMGPPGFDLITLGLVDKEKIPKYELTVEDGRRLAKENSRILMRQHRARRAAETGLLQLKKEAIEALPDHLKAAALVPDMTPFPANRFMATLTPPIEGYIDKITEAQKKNQGKAKLR